MSLEFPDRVAGAVQRCERFLGGAGVRVIAVRSDVEVGRLGHRGGDQSRSPRRGSLSWPRPRSEVDGTWHTGPGPRHDGWRLGQGAVRRAHAGRGMARCQGCARGGRRSPSPGFVVVSDFGMALRAGGWHARRWSRTVEDGWSHRTYVLERMPTMKFLTLLALWASASVGLAAETETKPETDRHVVVITIDGLPAYYLDDPAASLPVIRGLAADGVGAEGMRVSNPSVTWPNHTTLMTGVHPERHGVLYNGVLERSAAGARPDGPEEDSGRAGPGSAAVRHPGGGRPDLGGDQLALHARVEVAGRQLPRRARHAPVHDPEAARRAGGGRPARSVRRGQRRRPG